LSTQRQTTTPQQGLLLLLRHHRILFVFTFFFASRRRHTRSKRDWSSDVCSSDLGLVDRVVAEVEGVLHGRLVGGPSGLDAQLPRSGERRVGGRGSGGGGGGGEGGEAGRRRWRGAVERGGECGVGGSVGEERHGAG